MKSKERARAKKGVPMWGNEFAGACCLCGKEVGARQGTITRIQRITEKCKKLLTKESLGKKWLLFHDPSERCTKATVSKTLVKQ